MGLIELLLLAVGLAMDAFAVSVCKGLAAGKVTKKEFLLCGIWFGFFQGMMPFIGYLVGSRFEKLITMVAPWVAFGLLSLIGGNMIKEALSSDEETSSGFDVKTMFMMAVATSIDALAVGITFVAVPVEVFNTSRILNVLFAVIVIGVITFIISMIGVKIGSVFGDRFKSGAEIMGGTILLFIGFRALITYLDSSHSLSDNETIFGMLIPLLGTLLGSAVIYAKKNQLSDKMRAVLVGCSSGIMLSIAVWGMIEPAIDVLNQENRNGIIPLTICFCLGVVIQVVLDKLIPHTHVYTDLTEGPKSKLDSEIKIILKEIIHHIPEALCASLPLRNVVAKTGKAFLMGSVSGVPIPLLGIITVVLVVLFPSVLPYVMSVAGGALIYTTIEEIPQITLKKDNDKGALAFVAGFALVMLMIFLKIGN